MASVSVETRTNADPDKSWELLSDLNRWDEWLTIHQGWRGPVPTELTVGTRFTEVVSVMNMANKIEWTISELDVPKFLRIIGTGMAGVKVEFTLSVTPTDDGGTLASFNATFNGTMIVGPIGKAVAKNTKSELEKSIITFNELLG